MINAVRIITVLYLCASLVSNPGVILLLFQSDSSYCFQTMHREVLAQLNVGRTLVTSSSVAKHFACLKNPKTGYKKMLHSVSIYRNGFVYSYKSILSTLILHVNKIANEHSVAQKDAGFKSLKNNLTEHDLTTFIY